MISKKPYLIRALYDWIVDNDWSPHVIVQADYPDSYLPEAYIKNNEIVLNISPEAVRQLKLSNEYIEFDASFSGVTHSIYAPIEAVLAIYALENGEGKVFEPEAPSDHAQKKPKEITKKKPHLKIVE